MKQELNKGGNTIVLPEKIEFGWEQFVLSVTRTRTMRAQIEGLSEETRLRLSRDYGLGIAGSIAALVDQTTDEFSFTNGVYIFPDDERPSFAGNVGAAVADLVMENLGFYWRANASELNLKVVRDTTGDTKRRPDYVYDPGGQHGFEAGSVVIVEAKGSLSPKRAQLAPIKRLARSAYKGQVQDFIGAESEGLVVASGYAIAFGAVPGTQASKIAIVSPQTIFVAPRPARQLVSLSAAAIGNGERAHEQHGKIQEEEEADEEQDAAARSFFSLNATTVVIARL